MTKNLPFYTPHFGHVSQLRNIFQGHETGCIIFSSKSH